MGFKFPKKMPKEWIGQLKKANHSKIPPQVRLNNGGGDPNFGYETIGSTSNVFNHFIMGSVFTCPQNGKADSITVALKRDLDGNNHVKCAIYKHSDLSLVDETEEKLVALTSTPTWHAFNFNAPKPYLVENTDYILVAFTDYIDSICTYMRSDSGDTNQGHADEKTYDSFPDPLEPAHNDNKYSIYCSYTLYEIYYKTINSNARIKKEFTKSITGNANVVYRKYATVGANARIKIPTSKSITGTARIKKTLAQTITGNAKVAFVKYATIEGNARIKVPISKTIQGNASIAGTVSKTITGNAAIVFRKYETTTGNARIGSIQWYNTQLSYRFDRENKARAIAAVANSIGYEWWVDENGIFCFFNQRGQDKSATITLSDDIIEVDQSFDATKIIDKLTVVGMGPGSTHLEVTVGTGDMEGTFTAKNIHDIDTLTSFANTALEQTKEAKHRMIIKLVGTERTDIVLGDIVHVTHTDADIDGDYRIISMERVSGVAGDLTKLEIAVPQFKVTETLMNLDRRVDAEDYHPQGAPAILAQHESDNVDSTHPLKMKFYIPPEAVDMGKFQIKDAKIALTLEAFRAYSTGAASGGGHTSGGSSIETTAGGGGQTSSGGLAHDHTISGQTAQSQDLGTKTSNSKEVLYSPSRANESTDLTSFGTTWETKMQADVTEALADWTGWVVFPLNFGWESGDNDILIRIQFYEYGVGPWITIWEDFRASWDGNLDLSYSKRLNTALGTKGSWRVQLKTTGGTSDINSLGYNILVELKHKHDVTIGSHSHSVSGSTSSSESSHTHTVSDHTHGMYHIHEVYDHTHGIVYGIYESTSPMNVYIKLNDQQIAGPFNADEYVDITTEFLNQITTYGWNTLEFTSSQLGKIGATLFMRLFLQAS